jgi:hypothetical protein
MKHVKAGVLNVAYEESGAASVAPGKRSDMPRKKATLM